METHPRVAGHSFEKFVLPFDLDPQDDPIRSWTTTDGEGNRIFQNGLMNLNMQILRIRMEA